MTTPDVIATAGTTYRDATPEDADAMARHPLATRRGVAMLVELLCADDAWKACTAPQRRLLAEVCMPAVETLAEGVSLPAESLPWLPDTVPAGMRDALVRRGMAYESGQISAKAVHAAYWVAWRAARTEVAT